MNVVLMGPPGSGKGTQASELAAERGLKHIATGFILRSAVTAGTELGGEVEAILADGGLVPDAIMTDLIEKHLAAPTAQQGWLMDGFPRTRPQALGLQERLSGLGQKIDRVVVLDVPDDVIVARISRRLTCSACGEGTAHPTVVKDDTESLICPRCGKQALFQRTDDNEQTVRNRLEVYREQTVPAEDVLKAYYPLCRVDGVGELRAVAQRIRSALG
jgi:adenylate kinase